MTMVVMELTRAEGGDELATYGLNVCSVAIGRLSSKGWEFGASLRVHNLVSIGAGPYNCTAT